MCSSVIGYFLWSLKGSPLATASPQYRYGRGPRRSLSRSTPSERGQMPASCAPHARPPTLVGSTLPGHPIFGTDPAIPLPFPILFQLPPPSTAEVREVLPAWQCTFAGVRGTHSSSSLAFRLHVLPSGRALEIRMWGAVSPATGRTKPANDRLCGQDHSPV